MEGIHDEDLICARAGAIYSSRLDQIRGVSHEVEMNAAAHRITAGAAIFLVMAHQEEVVGENTAWPLAGGVAASVLTCLPDRIEPAINPNHRQFFHSLMFAVGLGYCFLKIRQLEPESKEGAIIRKIALVGIAAYLVHLALDATTAKSLPLVGRI